MASRSRLVQRSGNRDAPASSQARPQGSQQRRAVLPPYQPPSCPLTNQAKLQLTKLAAEADYAKYKKHLGACVSTLVNATADSNEALANAKLDLENRKQKRITRAARARGEDDGEGGEPQKSQDEIAQEAHVEALSGKVDSLTKAAEKAMRDLIDYTDELRAQDQLVTGVVDKASQQVPPRARRARSGEDEDEDMPDADEDAAAILSPTEILKQAREDYQSAYNNRTMANRYSRNKDYANFREMVHEAAGETEPLPPPADWFGADGLPRDRRATNQADHTANGSQEEEEEEDLVITGGVINTKCPLTLQTFKEPLGNHICKHVFEKSAIMEMLSNATVFYEGGGGRNRRGPGVKKLKCPTTGCEKMLEEKDFFDDVIMKRTVKRQRAAEAREAERAQEGGEESEEDVQGRSQKHSRRETMDLDQMRIRKERMAKMEPQSDDE